LAKAIEGKHQGKAGEIALGLAATVGGIRNSPLIFRIKVLSCVAKR